MIFLETSQLLLQLFVSTNLQINLCTVITPAFKCYVALRLFSYRPQMTSKMCWDTRRSWECRRCSYHILTSSVIWFRPTTTWNLFLAHSCWKQWMRYRSGADVDGSCRPWKEVVFRGRKLYYGPWREAVSHATPPHLMKVKINFDEAQKLTWKEIKCLYGLKIIITSNPISELLKMQLASKSRNVHT